MVPVALDLSGRKQQLGGLRGPLPPRLGRHDRFRCLAAHHQMLEGVIPRLSSTLHVLALHSNSLKVFLHVGLNNTPGKAHVMVFNNLLSCHLPRCNQVSAPGSSLAAIGNQLQRSPKETLPSWVSPMERNDIFWSSGREGLFLLLQVTCGSLLLACVLLRWARLRNGCCRVAGKSCCLRKLTGKTQKLVLVTL